MKLHKNSSNWHPSFITASRDAWKTARAGRQGIAWRQQARLAALVFYARSHSRYFADLYREVPEPCTDVGQLPVVTKRR
jgi:phenylacetate-CoA ligase